jgi:hypothetical protein
MVIGLLYVDAIYNPKYGKSIALMIIKEYEHTNENVKTLCLYMYSYLPRFISESLVTFR